MLFLFWHHLPFTPPFAAQITQADVRVPTGTAAAPEVYVVFQQLSLSALQYRGVVFIIGGTSTLVVALALQCFHWFFQRRKDLESHEALAHHD